MAIGTPTEHYWVTQTTAATTFAFSPATTVAAGAMAFCMWGKANSDLTSVTDSVGNTWTIDAATNDGTRFVAIASCQVATQITSSDTITLTLSNATSGSMAQRIVGVTGLATSSALDKTATANGSAATWSVGPTATLSQADEIGFGVFRSNGTSGTRDAAWSLVNNHKDNGQDSLEYIIVSATTALTATFTSSTGNWNAVLATYKMAGATAGSYQPGFRFGIR